MDPHRGLRVESVESKTLILVILIALIESFTHLPWNPFHAPLGRHRIEKNCADDIDSLGTERFR